ncbi:MAG TPA: nitroreductase family protein [Spirochaetia bacterium]|nr:nitroreductase family protein [Spirochaetales bacterium]HRY72792.1 nitroreductase family protein [Spirochaetia bacterium]
MNEILRSLFERKSARSFLDRPIGGAEKDLILDSAIQAPTAGNQALYTILDIEDQALKEALALSCDDQPFIAKAPLVLVFLADCRKWLDFYRYAGVEAREPGPGDLLLACADALVAAQNSVVAAESLGIGSCYIGDILENREKVVELLGLDDYTMPAAMLVYGYPAESALARRKPPRFGRKYLVRKDRYARLSEEEAREMLASTHPEPGFDFDAYMEAFAKRKYLSAFALELDRSAGEYLRRFAERDRPRS